MNTITLKRPITLPGENGNVQNWGSLSLRDIEAGDICDAGRELPDSASQTEMQLRVAAKCADLPWVIIRKMKPIDIVQVEAWWRKQWAGAEAKPGAEDEDPSKAGGTKPQS